METKTFKFTELTPSAMYKVIDDEMEFLNSDSEQPWTREEVTYFIKSDLADYLYDSKGNIVKS